MKHISAELAAEALNRRRENAFLYRNSGRHAKFLMRQFCRLHGLVLTL
jgi:hypothetical protein